LAWNSAQNVRPLLLDAAAAQLAASRAAYERMRREVGPPVPVESLAT
jgi:hypothetical protein